MFLKWVSLKENTQRNKQKTGDWVAHESSSCMEMAFWQVLVAAQYGVVVACTNSSQFPARQLLSSTANYRILFAGILRASAPCLFIVWEGGRTKGGKRRIVASLSSV